MLHVRQLHHAAQAGAEPGLHGGVVLVAFGHRGVVGAVVQQQLFVADQERAGIEQARVPVDQCQAAWAQDALPLGAHGHGVEPVESLCGTDQVNAGIGQAGGLGAAIDGGELRIVRRQPVFGGGAHGRIGFDGDQRMAGRQELPAGDAGACADVGDQRVGCHGHRAMQPVHQRGRIVRAVADIVRDAAAEAFSAVRGGHHAFTSAVQVWRRRRRPPSRRSGWPPGPPQRGC
ncbi:hypothetical protein D3C72_1557260 [compost metagenome]